MRKLVFIVILTLSGLSFSGCVVNQGNDVILKQDLIDKLIVNKTTKTEVIELLGKPPYTQRLFDREVISYNFTKSDFGLTVFSMGNSFEMTSLTLQFNFNGILIDKSLIGQGFDSANQKTGLGF